MYNSLFMHQIGMKPSALSIFNFLLFIITVISFSSVTAFAQQSQLTEKQSLIFEFRKLTGAQNVNLNINFSTDEIKDTLSSIVEQDKEITELQKQELRKFVAEANTRIDKTAQGFFADRTKISQVSETVIYQIYDKTFTGSELKELIAFYRTPVGQKAATFLPSLSSEVIKGFQEVIGLQLQNLFQPIIQTETEQLKQKLSSVKGKKGAN